MRNKIVSLVLITTLTSTATVKTIENVRLRKEMSRIRHFLYKSPYAPRTLIKKGLEEKEKQELVQTKIDEIAAFKRSDEYKKRLKIEELRRTTGLNVVDYQKVEFIKTYYTTLLDENGGYDVTCNGEKLEGKYDIVANNVIPQHTKILLGDNLVRVADKGAKSHFSVINRLDVLIQRIPGETDSQYKNRVRNLGRQKEVGYILTLGEE